MSKRVKHAALRWVTAWITEDELPRIQVGDIEFMRCCVITAGTGVWP